MVRPVLLSGSWKMFSLDFLLTLQEKDLLIFTSLTPMYRRLLQNARINLVSRIDVKGVMHFLLADPLRVTFMLVEVPQFNQPW